MHVVLLHSLHKVFMLFLCFQEVRMIHIVRMQFPRSYKFGPFPRKLSFNHNWLSSRCVWCQCSFTIRGPFLSQGRLIFDLNCKISTWELLTEVLRTFNPDALNLISYWRCLSSPMWASSSLLKLFRKPYKLVLTSSLLLVRPRTHVRQSWAR